MSPAVQFFVLLAVVLALVLLAAKPLGHYVAHVLEGPRRVPRRRFARIEHRLYRLCGIDDDGEMSWGEYSVALLVFNVAGAFVVYMLQRTQQWLPLNPQTFAAVTADSSFNTAISFVTNTDWQSYSGESTMGYLVQSAALTVQNFLSSATGLAVAMVLIRGFTRRSSKTVGNFWLDVSRGAVYVLLPLSLILAMALASQGVIQNYSAYKSVATVEAQTYDSPRVDSLGNALQDAQGMPLTESKTIQRQDIPMGPVASQEAIKQIGTNGGGFYAANSAHGFENPSYLTNLLQIIAMLLLPFALTCTVGKLVGDTRQGWALAAAMLVLFGVLAATAYFAEQLPNPLIAAQGVDSAGGPAQAGGNMEGKETRFGIAASALFAAATTSTSCGAVDSMHDSLSPIGGLITLFSMQLGELTPGGVGTGIYTMLIYAILGVFIAGLMIGRTPEYLGKKIEAREMKLAAIFILTTPLLVLAGTAIGVMTSSGTVGIANPGAHGFSEVLYAFTSAGNNNGSAFGGLSVNTVFYNVTLGIVMWIGRFWPIVAALAIAGSLAAKKRLAVTEGTMPTHGPLFIGLLIATILLIGVLNYIPALALGPVIEHLTLLGGR